MQISVQVKGKDVSRVHPRHAEPSGIKQSDKLEKSTEAGKVAFYSIIREDGTVFVIRGCTFAIRFQHGKGHPGRLQIATATGALSLKNSQIVFMI